MLHDILLEVDKNNSYFEATILIGFVESIWYVDTLCSFVLLAVAIVSCPNYCKQCILYPKKRIHSIIHSCIQFVPCSDMLTKRIHSIIHSCIQFVPCSDMLTKDANIQSYENSSGKKGTVGFFPFRGRIISCWSSPLAAGKGRKKIT
jgi:hypothetical protein